MNESKNFEEKYCDLFLKVTRTDFLNKAYPPGIEQRGDSLLITFYNRQLILDKTGIRDLEDMPLTFAVRFVICRYLLANETSAANTSEKLVTLRELTDSGPLFSNVVTNTGKIIETTFSGRCDHLREKCRKLHGTFIPGNSYDLCVRFNAVEGVPIILSFNDQDEMMPAKALFLFQANAGNYLDIESLTILCTYLTGQLIN